MNLNKDKKIKRRVLVHIGIEKTGTSTIQEFLHINRSLLADHGIAYLKSPGLRNNRKFVTYCMAFDNVDDHVLELEIKTRESRELWKKSFRAELDLEINSLSPEVHSVIISSEHFHSRLYSEQEILDLYKLLTSFFSEIKIIVYLRRQDKVATSLYSTACRVGHAMNHVLPNGVLADNHYYNYFNLLEKWSNVFGKKNIIPRIFEKEKMIEEDLLADFSFFSGMKQINGRLIRCSNQNESLSEIVQEVLIGFNKNFNSDKANIPSTIIKKLRQNIINKMEGAFKGKAKMPTKQEAIRFYEIFEESNKKLAEKWFQCNPLFSNDFSIYPEKKSPNSKEEHEILDYLFVAVSEFLNNFLLFPKELFNNINLQEDKGAIFRDIGLLFEETNPEISLFLMNEALKYRPEGQFIKQKAQMLRSSIKERASN